MKPRNPFHLLACGLAAWTQAVALAGEGDQAGAAERIPSAMWAKHAAEASEIVFYGEIVDQYNQPVAGSWVEVNVPMPAGYLQEKARKCQIQSDEEGRFEVSKKTFGLDALKGTSLRVDVVGKNGYEYIRGTDPKLSFSYRNGDPDKLVPDPQAPIAFHMRKIEGEATFLLEEPYLELRIDVADSGTTIGYDAIRGVSLGGPDRVAGVDRDECDLKVTAVYSTNRAAWSVTLAPGDAKGGIVASEQLLHEAPDVGYQAEYAFMPKDRGAVDARYVYLRNRDPAIYARLEIKGINASERFFRLFGRFVTNPYGDRSLEPMEGLSYEETKRLTDEVRAAFQQNKRPSRPEN